MIEAVNALRRSPYHPVIATVGVRAVVIYAANASVGVLACGDPFSWRTAAGLIAACATVILLEPTD